MNPGDIVQSKLNNIGKPPDIDHTMVVTGKTKKDGVLISQHSTNLKNVPLNPIIKRNKANNAKWYFFNVIQ